MSNFSSWAGDMLKDIRDIELRAATKRAEKASTMRQVVGVGVRHGGDAAQAVAASIGDLATLTGPEILLLVSVLASKVRQSEAVGYSDAIADAMEYELPNAMWAMCEDNPDKYPEEA